MKWAASALPRGTFPTASSRTRRATFMATGSPGRWLHLVSGCCGIHRTLWVLSTFPWTPSPCIGHYPDHLSTMSPLSPCTSRRVGDPEVSPFPVSPHVGTPFVGSPEQMGGCDLIVLATERHGALRHLVSGSLPEQVLDATRIPLLVVRPHEAPAQFSARESNAASL
jgi:Universal stress protein family